MTSGLRGDMMGLENLFAERAELAGSPLPQRYDKKGLVSYRMTSIPQNTKYCSRCNTVKPLADFYQLGTRGGRQKGYDHECKECAKKTAWVAQAHGLKRNYNLTEEQYQAMLAQQKGLCAICGQPSKRGQRLYVDHCHTSMAIRGLLCHHCNTLLGNAKDNPEILESALKYLKKHDN